MRSYQNIKRKKFENFKTKNSTHLNTTKWKFVAKKTLSTNTWLLVFVLNYFILFVLKYIILYCTFMENFQAKYRSYSLVHRKTIETAYANSIFVLLRLLYNIFIIHVALLVTKEKH